MRQAALKPGRNTSGHVLGVGLSSCLKIGSSATVVTIASRAIVG